MKLARTGRDGHADWSVIDPDEGTARPILEPFARWAPALTASSDASVLALGRPVALAEVELLVPLHPGATVFGCGATYARHVHDLGLTMPTRPAAFLRAARSIVGPTDEITHPSLTSALDYEAELVVVVGRTIEGGEPEAAILGYTVGNEVSARDLQFDGGVTGMDMFSGKSLDGTAPLGPWIVTRDEFGPGHPDLEITLTVDGEVRQHDRTSSMVWSTAFLLGYIDERSRVGPGDVLFTGTTSGVGHEDGRYLQPGQVVEVTIEGIGKLRNVVGPLPR